MSEWLFEAGRLIVVQVTSLVLAFLAAAWIIRSYNARRPRSPFAGKCAYCGAPADGEAEMMAHIQECDVHPLQKMRAEVRRVHAEMKRIYALTEDGALIDLVPASPSERLAHIRDLAGRNF